MGDKIKSYGSITISLIIYFFFIGFITPFNFTGWTPIPLIISFLILVQLIFLLFSKGVLIFKITLLDQLFFSFLIYSLFTVLMNSFRQYSFNYNHLLAHFVVFGCYYFVIKSALANSYFGTYEMIILGIKLAFWTIAIIAIVDYFLTLRSIHFSDFIPMPIASPPAGLGIFLRAKGFFVEPTDFGMGINAFGPILISYYYNNRKIRLFVLVLLTFIFCHLISRSSAAISFLVMGMFISIFINKRFYNLKFSKLFGRLTFFIIVIFIIISSYLYEYLYAFQSDIIGKVLFDSDSSSSLDRRNAWKLMTQVFLEGNLFIGYGTGYVAGSGLTSLNWYLTVLVENGILGIFILLLIIIVSLKKITNIQPEIKFGYLVSFIAVFGHLFTQSGFYFPFPWTLVAIIPFLKMGKG